MFMAARNTRTAEGVRQCEIRFSQLLNVNSKMEVVENTMCTAFKPRIIPPHEIRIRAKIRKCYGSVSIAAQTAAVFALFSLATRSDAVFTGLDS
jgi:hypothetical protein